MNTHISRRGFLGSAAGLTFSLAVAGRPLDLIGEAGAQASYAPNVWLTIANDGTISIVSPAAEMGQGRSRRCRRLSPRSSTPTGPR